MGQSYGSEIHGSHLRLLIALFGAMLLLTDGGNITWLEPPPVQTVTDASSISTTTLQVIQGSLNKELSCSFSLSSDMRALVVILRVGNDTAAIVVQNESPSVPPKQFFSNRFNVTWVPNKLTLIFLNATDAHEAEYVCQVTTVGRSARVWIRKIQLLVFDPIKTTVSAVTASVDPSQAMVSSIKSQSLIQTTKPSSSTKPTASEVDVPWDIIEAVVGVAFFIIIIIIAIGRYLKWRKRSQKVRRENRQGTGSEENDLLQVQSGTPSADGAVVKETTI